MGNVFIVPYVIVIVTFDLYRKKNVKREKKKKGYAARNTF